MRINTEDFNHVISQFDHGQSARSYKNPPNKIPHPQVRQRKNQFEAFFRERWNPLSHPRGYQNPNEYENSYLRSLLKELVPVTLILLMFLTSFISGKVTSGEYHSALRAGFSSTPLLIMLFMVLIREKQTRQ